MATIPIEIVLQDAESPVEPTPTPEEETDIAVPETGIISNGNGSNNGIGSAASIILPAIIAVLAISALVAIIVHRYQKRKSDTEATKLSRKEKLATVASGTIAILAATVLVGNLVIPATKAATTVEPGTAELETDDKITIIATREQDSDTITATVKDTSYATANLDFGYKVTASMAEGLDNANLYLNGDETSEYYIAPVENARLGDNTWGYRLSEEDEDYLSIPLANTPATMVKGIAQIAEDTAVDIYYTVQIGKDMPNGTYIGELEYTLSPAIEYMQDFSTLTAEEKTATLTNMPEGKQYILKDIRDKNSYYISKLADGNVWMTQNLDLELNNQTKLTPANTNITADWIPENSTISFIGTSVSGWQNNNNVPYSADPGDVYYYTSNTNDNDMKYNSLAECEAERSDGTCQHYHAGNYYNWSAAVAMSDTSGYGDDDQYVNVETSICPAGWRLPKNRNADSPTEGNEQDTMISSYNSIVGELHSGCGGTCMMRDYLDGGFNKIRTAPLWLARSGYVNSGSLYATGGRGHYWSSTVSNSNGAYTLYFNSGNAYPASSDGRIYGYSVRCVAQ